MTPFLKKISVNVFVFQVVKLMQFIMKVFLKEYFFTGKDILFSDCSGVMFCKEFRAISLFCYKMSVCNLTKNNTPLLAYFTFWNDSIVTNFETHDKLKYFFKRCLKKFLYIPLHKIRWHRTRYSKTDVQQRLDCLLKYFFSMKLFENHTILFQSNLPVH